MKKTVEQRFWEKVDKSPGRGPKGTCWLWTACTDWKGYGGLYVSGNQMRAHRFSWELHNGLISEGLCVLHRCDNRPCVNPEHLFLGSVLDNNRDMAAKKRSRYFLGENNRTAKLTNAKVLAIRSRWPGATKTSLAKEFGVSRHSIYLAVHRKTWRHI